MQGAAAPPIQPVVPSRKPIAAALVALIAGGAIATGVWWLTDNDVDILPQPDSVTRVIVSPSVEPGSGTVAKNEAQTAAAVGVSPPVIATGTGTAVKNEAGSAAAIGSQHGTSQYHAGVAAGAGTAAKNEAGAAATINVNPSTGQATIEGSQAGGGSESQAGPGANTD
jgi:hypothetical protein